MNFRILGLPAEPFVDLFLLSDGALAARGAVRCVADGQPGYPCRISLTDAQPGDEVILMHYEHHAVATPFRASHAIYVRAGERHYDEIDRVPPMLRSRMLSLRAFDGDGMLVDADLVEGRELEGLVERLFTNRAQPTCTRISPSRVATPHALSAPERSAFSYTYWRKALLVAPRGSVKNDGDRNKGCSHEHDRCFQLSFVGAPARGLVTVRAVIDRGRRARGIGLQMHRRPRRRGIPGDAMRGVVAADGARSPCAAFDRSRRGRGCASDGACRQCFAAA